LKNRGFCAVVLTAALVCGLCLPVSAAPRSSFQDVTNDTTAVNADVLRLMGVVNGVGDNCFNPDASLSRAEFCVMVTNFIQRGDEVSRYASRTIFRDVTGKHWARGYINLMASPVADGAAMISGIGDGSFAPDQKVTTAQAITVLLRVLGYSSKETGFIWPESYMELANSIGLLDGVSTSSNSVITRAQAAQIFVNALGAPVNSGQPYYTTLGSVSKDTILLAVNVESDDGSSGGAIRTSLNGESFLPAVGNVSPYALQGKRGALVLDEKDEIVTFFPDDSNSINVILSGNAQPSYLKGTNGVRYTMTSSTLLYTAGSTTGVNYIEGYTSLRTGTQVTLFTQAGKIVAVYAPGSTDNGMGAVVVSGKVSESMFSRLTGGTSGWDIIKNGQPITLDEIQSNDVVTYDQVNNALIVSDFRITGIYKDAAPNASAPQVITVLGHEFDVLDSAWDNMDSVKIGDTVNLLLTSDGKVAGIKKTTQAAKANAIGLATQSGVELFLPNGNTFLISGSFSGTKNCAGQLVTVLGDDTKGRLNVSPITARGTAGSLDFDTMTLGSKKVAAGLRVFDQVRDSVSVEVDVSTLPNDISSADIKAYHTNSSGYIDCIILNNFTGNAYRYGICRVETDEEGEQFVSFENGVDGGFSGLQTAISVKNNQISGVAIGGDGKLKNIIELNLLKNVSPADFFDYQGDTYLEYDGQNYLVSDDVVCYKQANKLWFTNETGSARLAACRAFSDTLSAYYDPFTQQIRVVTAE